MKKKLIKLNINIKIHPTFFILMFVLIFLKLGKYFLILFAITTLHEMTHIVVALLYKCKVGKITLTPLGEIASIDGIENLSPAKRILIAIAGPMFNIVLGSAMYYFLWGKWDIADYIVTANFAIGLFNLLPIYPLDGGRIVHVILGNTIGIINSNRILYNLSKILSAALILLGFLQIVLYPYNLSILGIGLYISYTSKKERINMSYIFYNSILKKYSKINEQKHIKLNNIVITQNAEIDTALKLIKWDYYHIFHIYNGKSITKQISEAELLEHAISNSMKDHLETV